MTFDESNSNGIDVVQVPPNPPQPPPGRKPPSVMLSVPSGRAWEARTATAVAGMLAYSALQGVTCGLTNLEGSMITKQRNDLVVNTRKNKMDYIMFIDSDMLFPPDALLRLLRHDKDIVGATYNKRVAPYETLGKLKGDRPTDEALQKGGLFPAECLPGGFMLVKMSVYEKIRWPWYYESYQWPGADGVEAWKNMMRDMGGGQPTDEMLAVIEGTPFAEWLNEVHKIESQTEWQYFSEDLSFCRKAAKAGIELWADLSLTYDISHLGTSEITCKPPVIGGQSVIVPAEM